MSRQVPGHPGLFWDTTVRLYFRYDQQTDELVYNNGQRVPRPTTVPRSSFLPRDIQSSYQYQSPPSSSDGYVQNTASPSPYPGTSPAGYYASPAPLPHHPQGTEAYHPPGRHQNHPSIDAVTVSMQNVAISPAELQSQSWVQHGVSMVHARDPQSQVQTIIGTGPPDRITDPDLLRRGVQAVRRLYGTQGDRELLYSNFKLRKHDFFCVGRVFLILWAEPAGESRTIVSQQELNDGTLPGRFQDERIYSKVRRFVVVREQSDYCSALPIMTYGKQGVSKHGVNKSEHAIIYTGSQPPRPLAGEMPRTAEELPMRQHSIRVTPDDREEKLDPLSRIDFGKVHTIQHNLKVKPFGLVHPKSIEPLMTQFNNVWLGHPGSSASNVSGPRSASSSGASPSRRRTSIAGTSTTRGGNESRLGSNLQVIESDQEDNSESESESEEDTASNEDPTENSSVTRTRQLYNSYRGRGRTHEQAINSMIARLRQANPSLSREAALAHIRDHL